MKAKLKIPGHKPEGTRETFPDIFYVFSNVNICIDVRDCKYPFFIAKLGGWFGPSFKCGVQRLRVLINESEDYSQTT